VAAKPQESIKTDFLLCDLCSASSTSPYFRFRDGDILVVDAIGSIDERKSKRVGGWADITVLASSAAPIALLIVQFIDITKRTSESVCRDASLRLEERECMLHGLERVSYTE
jgi:hypothetical protein